MAVIAKEHLFYSLHIHHHKLISLESSVVESKYEACLSWKRLCLIVFVTRMTWSSFPIIVFYDKGIFWDHWQVDLTVTPVQELCMSYPNFCSRLSLQAWWPLFATSIEAIHYNYQTIHVCLEFVWPTFQESSKKCNYFSFQGKSNYTQEVKLQMMKRCTPGELKLILLSKYCL